MISFEYGKECGGNSSFSPYGLLLKPAFQDFVYLLQKFLQVVAAGLQPAHICPCNYSVLCSVLPMNTGYVAADLRILLFPA